MIALPRASTKGILMSKAPRKPEILFRDMTGSEKAAFSCKAMVFLVSGGFIFPTIWID